MKKKVNPALARWRAHVMAFARKHKLNYAEALKHPKIKMGWK
jgi:hypothetical protein